MYYTWGSQNSFNSSYLSLQHQNLGFDFVPEQYYGLYHYDLTGNLYPTVVYQFNVADSENPTSDNVAVNVNFGQRPFRYQGT